MRKNMVYCIIFSMLLVFLPSLTIKADSTGYYYENIDVEVEVNSKREFKITETLDVYMKKKCMKQKKKRQKNQMEKSK